MIRRLAAIVVAAWFAAAALGVGALATAPPANAAYCDDYPFLCAMLAYGPEGDGSGVITTSDGFINCAWNGRQIAGTCTHRYVVPANVSWTMDPDVGSEVCAGGCSASQLTGTAHLEEGGQTYGGFPEFRLLPLPTLTLAVAGPGRIRAQISGSSTYCPPTCTRTLELNQPVTLTAMPDAGAVFETWLGSCESAEAVCDLVASSDVSTNARFSALPTPSPGTPNPTPKPTATPKPATKPAGTPRATTGPAAGSTSAPVATDAPRMTPGLTGGPPAAASAAASAPIASVPMPAGAAPSMPATLGPAEPAGSNDRDALDLTPVVLAIIGAGLLVGLGIFGAAFVLRRRSAG